MIMRQPHTVWKNMFTGTKRVPVVDSCQTIIPNIIVRDRTILLCNNNQNLLYRFVLLEFDIKFTTHRISRTTCAPGHRSPL